jgi:hydrogenase expression/formation protein HypC
MCLAIPGKIIEIYDLEGTLMCKVDLGGAQQEVCIATTPEANPGDYILVHAGFSLNILTNDEAEATIELLKNIELFNAAHPELTRD